MYLNGYDAPANALLGYQWLERAANAGNKVPYNLGYYRYHGITQDTARDQYGITSLKAAAQAGVREAQELLGTIYLLDKWQYSVRCRTGAEIYDLRPQTVVEVVFAKFALGYIAYEYDKDYKKRSVFDTVAHE